MNLRTLLLAFVTFVVAVVFRVGIDRPIAGPALILLLASIQLVVGLTWTLFRRIRRQGDRTQLVMSLAFCVPAIALASLLFRVETHIGRLRIAFGLFLVALVCLFIELILGILSGAG